MCLYIEGFSLFPKIALRPITVYKFMKVDRYGEMRSPYQYFQYEFGKLYTSPLEKEIDCMGQPICEVGLHSLVHASDASDFAGHNRKWGDVVAVECTIPKYSRYYTGFFNDMQSIASNQIIIDRVHGDDWITPRRVRYNG